jgi:hypothetical protein
MDEILACCWRSILFPLLLLAAPGQDAFLRWRLSARSAGRVPARWDAGARGAHPPHHRPCAGDDVGALFRAPSRMASPGAGFRRAGGFDAGGATSLARLVEPARTLAPGPARDPGGGAERAGRSRLSRHAARPGVAARRARAGRLLRRSLRRSLPGVLDGCLRLRPAASRWRPLRDHARREAPAPPARFRVARP